MDTRPEYAACTSPTCTEETTCPLCGHHYLVDYSAEQLADLASVQEAAIAEATSKLLGIAAHLAARRPAAT